MRRGIVGKNKRAELAWTLAGFVLAQLLLGLGVDWSWLSVRDPEFQMIRGRLAARRAEAPTRPLVLTLGSSRTEMGLDAGKLSRSSDRAAPLVFNFAVPASGPMFQQVVLRRLLEEGVRPDKVFIEVMPMSMSRRNGTPLEEHQLDGARLDAVEMARLLPYYQQPDHLILPWVAARLLSNYRHQAELRDAFGLDANSDETGLNRGGGVDGYGWRKAAAPPIGEDAGARVQNALDQFGKALNDPVPAEGPLRALQDLLGLCRRKGISAALVIPPEATVFRAIDAQHAAIEEAIRRIVGQYHARLYDASAWVDDSGFYDGHHLSAEGAVIYTERFAREALRPEMNDFSPRQGEMVQAGAR